MMNYNIKRKNKLSDNQHQHQQPHPTQQQSQSQPSISLQQHQQHPQHQQHQQFNDSLNLTNVLHYLQSEWRRYERDRNEWEIERAEITARLALLEGEKRSSENIKSDLIRRVKMLEFALRQERVKYLAHSQQGQQQSSSSPKSQDSVESDKDNRDKDKQPSAIHPNKKASLKDNDDQNLGNISPKSSDDNQSINSQFFKPIDPSKQTKSHAKCRAYLQQCLEEINYLLNPSNLNPLHNRPYKDIDSIEVEKVNEKDVIPQSVPMESVQSNEFMNNFTNSLQIQQSPQGPILSQTIPQSSDSVQASLAAPPTGPSSPPPLTKQLNDDDYDDTSPSDNQNYGDEIDESDNETINEINYDNSNHDGENNNNDDDNDDDDIGDNTVVEQQQDLHHQSSSNDKDTNNNIIAKDYEEAIDDDDDDDNDVDSLNNPKDIENNNLIPSQNPINAKSVDDNNNSHQLLKENQQPVVLISEERSEKSQNDDNNVDKNDELSSLSIDMMDNDNESIKSSTSNSSTKSSSAGLWKPWKTLKSHIDPIRALAFIYNEETNVHLLISGGDDTVLKYWRIEDDDEKHSYDISPSVNLRGHSGPITSITVSKTRNAIYTSSIDSTIREWEITYDEGDLLEQPTSLIGREFIGHTNSIWDVKTTFSGKVVSGSSDRSLKIWNEESGQLENTIYLKYPIAGIDIEPNENFIIVGFANNTSSIISFAGDVLDLQFVVKDVESDVNAQFNAVIIDGDRLYSAHEDGKIRLWSMNDGSQIESLIAHLDSCTSIQFQPNSSVLCSSSHDCSLRFWNTDKFSSSQTEGAGVAHAACVQELGGHRKVFNEGVNDLSFNNEGTLFASGGADGSIKLYYR